MKMNCVVIAMIVTATQVFAGQPDVTKQYDIARKQVEAYGMAAYSNGLIAAGFQYKKDANLNAYLVIQAEQKRFAENPSIEAGVTNGNLVIREVAMKSLNDYNVKLAALLRLYVTNLNENVRSLMLANKIDEAKAVKEKMTAAEFELALLEPKLPKAEGGGRKLVVWNSHNGWANNSGTLAFDITLYLGKKVVWEKKGVDIPWQPNIDYAVTNDVPADIQFNLVRIDITKLREYPSLSEIQVFEGTRNIAQKCKVTAGSSILPPQALTDGITGSGAKDKGYWIGNAGQPNWIEIDLTKKTSTQK